MGLLILYVAIALGVSFLCSIFEAVLLSVSPAYLAMLSRERPTAGKRLQRLKDDIDRPLAAILSLNTIAHTFGAAGAGAQAAVVFGNAWLGVASAVLTLAILVFSEIIPKTVGAMYYRRLAPMVAKPLNWLVIGLYPFVLLSQGITRLVSRGEKQRGIDPDEVEAMAEMAAFQGLFEHGENHVLRNLFRFSELRVRDIMTPRTVVFALAEENSIQTYLEQHKDQPFSRIPVYGKNRDEITGYVLRDDLLRAGAIGQTKKKLSEFRRPFTPVLSGAKLPTLFDRLLTKRAEMALVVDEYGGMSGIVTSEDLLETLLGMEIIDERDTAVDMREEARKRWKARALKLGLEIPDDEPGSDPPS